jgi:hypothetical protein
VSRGFRGEDCGPGGCLHPVADDMSYIPGKFFSKLTNINTLVISIGRL